MKYLFYFQIWWLWRLGSDFKTAHILGGTNPFLTGNKKHFVNQNRKWKPADPFYFNVNEATRFLLLSSMTTLVSDKVHLFTEGRDIPIDKPWVFHFLKKVTCGFLDDAKNCQNLTFKVKNQRN